MDFNNFNNGYYKLARPQTNMDWIMVQNINQVEQISVQPGQKAWIMVQNEPVFALRVADNMGLVSTDYYKFEKYNMQATAPLNDNYVTKDEMYKAIEKAVKEIKHESITTEDEQ